jgi:hypothetical protein
MSCGLRKKEYTRLVGDTSYWDKWGAISTKTIICCVSFKTLGKMANQFVILFEHSLILKYSFAFFRTFHIHLGI